MSKQHKLIRSGHKKNYYALQFAVTAVNKSRRAARRQRRAVNELRRQMLKRLPKNEANRQAGIDHAGMGHQGT